MKKNVNITLNYFLIILIGLFFNACYTIIDIPVEEQESQHNQSENFSDSLVSEDAESYTVINNYICNHSSNCCGHDHCHTYSRYHSYSCGGYCQLTFNWWTGTYHWNYYDYHHYHHNHYDYGYYNGYHDGYHDGYWWGYNNWDDNNDSYEYGDSDNTQERRDRSFTRDNSDDYVYNNLEAPNNSDSGEEGSPEPLIQKAPSANQEIQPSGRINKNKKTTYQRTNTHSKNRDLVPTQSKKSRSYKSSSSIHSNKISGKSKQNHNFSKNAGSIIDLIGMITSLSSSKKSSSKSKNYNRKSSNKKSKNKSTSKSGKSKRRR